MSTKLINVTIAIILVSALAYYFVRENDDIQKTYIELTSNSMTVFDPNTTLYSDAFIKQFKMSYDMNEHWLGILIKKNDIYELHHFTLPVEENTVDYDLDITNVSELFICSQHLEHFEGAIVGTSSKMNISQIQIYNDTNSNDASEVTGSSFTGIIDVYAIDLDAIHNDIVFKYYPGNIEQTPMESWHFNLINK